MTRRQLPPPSSVIRQLRNIILEYHADLDGACAGVGIDRARLTERQVLNLQQTYRQATSLLRARLMTRVLEAAPKDADDRLLAQQIGDRERLQSTWTDPEAVNNLYGNLPDDVLGALEAFYSGDENAFEALINQRIQSRLLALRGPEGTLNGRRRRRLEDRNVSRRDGQKWSPPPDPVQKNLPTLARDQSQQKNLPEPSPDDNQYPDQITKNEQPSAPRAEQQPKRSTGSFWSVQSNSGIQGPTLYTEEYEQPVIKKNRKWPPTGSKLPDDFQPFFPQNGNGRQED